MYLNRQWLATASTVWHELQYGFERMRESKKRRDIEDYLSNVVLKMMPILPYDQTAADWHAAQRAELSRMGKTPSYMDGQIAAVAAVNDLILVTRNVRDFENFPGLEIEYWHTE